MRKESIMEKKELCSCCKQQGEFDQHWHFTIPDVGYGSIFDYVDPHDKIEFIVCHHCFDKINAWLIKNYPRINLIQFWKFEIIDTSEENQVPSGYCHELKYEIELLCMLMRFMPEVFYGRPINIFKKYICRIIYAPMFHHH